MEKHPYLVFSLNGELFAIAAGVVREMFWLPELTPIEEAPSCIAGVLNLRKKIIPVTDLNLLFGHDCRKYLLTDSVIVLGSVEQQKVEDEVEKLRSYEVGKNNLSASQPLSFSTSQLHETRDTLHEIRFFGLIVNEVLDVIDISSDDIEPSPFNGKSEIQNLKSKIGPYRHPFIDSEAMVGEDIIMILNHHRILDFGFGNLDLEETEEHGAKEYFENEWKSKIQNPNSKILGEFHERAVNLMQAAVEDEIAGLLPIAVVGIGGEYFGVDLELILEFSGIPDLTPIPCCPEHILGNMNLRGNVLTVIDIRNFLNLPYIENSKIQNPNPKIIGKVIVADTGGLSAGIAVDSVCDVIYLNPADIRPLPSAVRATAEQYVRGTAPYNDKVMTIIDLKKILASEELVVNEEA